MTADFLVIVAHPDDETLGCAHLLMRSPLRGHILHTTDGAPREQRFWAQAGADSREAYAAARRSELLDAMDALGFSHARLARLSFADRDLVTNLQSLAGGVREWILRVSPSFVYTHPFEGGHPDHDATCLAVHAVCARLREEGRLAPEVREFPCYHARNGEFFSGDFLSEHGVPRLEPLSDEERGRKRAALDCFRSQQRVIQRFAIHPEQWRKAPPYSFTERPHRGPLYYEIREMGVTFTEFAAAARDAFPEVV